MNIALRFVSRKESYCKTGRGLWAIVSGAPFYLYKQPSIVYGNVLYVSLSTRTVRKRSNGCAVQTLYRRRADRIIVTLATRRRSAT